MSDHEEDDYRYAEDELLYFKDDIQLEPIIESKYAKGKYIVDGKQIIPSCGCGKTYSCTSALYLHIKKKHDGIKPDGTVGGPRGPEQVNRYEYDYAKYYQQDSSYFTMNSMEKLKVPATTCKCGKTYSCISSLNLHIRKCHLNPAEDVIQSTQPEDTSIRGRIKRFRQKEAEAKWIQQHIQKKAKLHNEVNTLPYVCGCSRAYSTAIQLMKHVNKRHQGIPPDGSIFNADKNSFNFRPTQISNMKVKIESKEPTFPKKYQKILNHHENFEHPLSLMRKPKPKKNANENESEAKAEIERICGCGNNYSCSSSLNLHIRRCHNGIPPDGTIGGPKGFNTTPQRQEHTVEKIKKMLCSECKCILKESMWVCNRCRDWRYCGSCDEGAQSMDKDHHQRGHQLSVINSSEPKGRDEAQQTRIDVINS